jgi:Flp pilus assembly pilin Flp
MSEHLESEKEPFELRFDRRSTKALEYALILTLVSSAVTWGFGALATAISDQLIVIADSL